jgi:hypothetical protein
MDLAVPDQTRSVRIPEVEDAGHSRGFLCDGGTRSLDKTTRDRKETGNAKLKKARGELLRYDVCGDARRRTSFAPLGIQLNAAAK